MFVEGPFGASGFVLWHPQANKIIVNTVIVNHV